MKQFDHNEALLYPSLQGKIGDAMPCAMTPSRDITIPTTRVLTPSPPRMLVGEPAKIDALFLILSSCKKEVIAHRVVLVNTKSDHNCYHVAGPEFRVLGMDRG